MDKKDIKSLEKLFWEDKPGAYNFRTFDEIEEKIKEYKKEKREVSRDRQKEIFEERYTSSPTLRLYDRAEAEALSYQILCGEFKFARRYILTIGIYDGYKTGDMSILKNALYTQNRINYADDLVTWGSNSHARHFADVIYAFADCDLKLVKKYFPEKFGIVSSRDTHHFYIGTNLIMSMLYSNKTWLEEALKPVEKFMKAKGSIKSCILGIRYLIALSQQDIDEASKLLQEIADIYRKISWIHNFGNPFLKFFGVYIHGLYNLAYFVLPQEKFNQLRIPEHSVFWKEFDHYTKENNFNSGSLCIKVADQMSDFKLVFD